MVRHKGFILYAVGVEALKKLVSINFYGNHNYTHKHLYRHRIGGMMEGDKIPATHSRAKMAMHYNEPSNEIEKRKQKRQARREYRRYLKEDLRKEGIAPSFWHGLNGGKE